MAFLTSSPRCKYFVAVRTRIAVVLDALVDDLDVSVEMSLLAEHFLTNWTRGWLVNLYVEMNLQKIPDYYVKFIYFKFFPMLFIVDS